MRILIVGHGAREHAMAARLASEGCEVLSCHAKPNAGLSAVCSKCFVVPNYSAAEIIPIAIEQRIDLLLPANEQALFAGVVDAAIRSGIPCVGHTKKAAEVIERHRALVISSMLPVLPVRPPRGCIANHVNDIKKEINTHQKVAVKPLGVNFGGRSYQSVYFLTAENFDIEVGCIPIPAWVEPFIPGRDFSIHYVFTSGVGKRFGVTLDYPLLGRESEILTGGMGCVSLPDKNDILSVSVIEKCAKMIESGLNSLICDAGISLSGFVSAQFRVTDCGVIFTEMNCKPGDPEIIALLEGFDGNFLDLLTSGLECVERTKLFSIALVMAPTGYPNEQRLVATLPADMATKPGIFLGESCLVNDRLVSGDSRMACVVKRSSSLSLARSSVMACVAELASDGTLFYRPDVGDIETKNASGRVRASLLKLKERGGKRLMLRLSPEAFASMRRIMGRSGFKTETEAINAVLIAEGLK